MGIKKDAVLRPTMYGFNVADFGAVGDGVTSDSAAIQSALDAANAAGGGTVVVNIPGTYLLTETNTTLFSCLTIYSNTSLVGVPGVKFKRQSGLGKYMIRNADPTNGNTNIQISGIEWDANSAWVAREGTYTAGTRTLVFDNCATRSATIPYWTFSATDQDICEFMALTGAGTLVVDDRCLIESATYAPATAGGRLTIVLAASTGTTSWASGGVTWETAGNTNLTSVKVRIRRATGGSNATTGWVRSSMLFVNCKDLVIRNNIFRNEFKYSTWVSGGSNILEENNTFYTSSDGHHHEGPLDRVTIRDIRGVCEDNMVAFSSDEGTFFTPNDGPFTAGSITNVLVDGIQVMGGLTPFSIFGNPEYTARNITVRNLSGFISEGNALSIKDITSNLVEGINLQNFLAENIDINLDYVAASAPPGIIIDMRNVVDLTFKNVNFTWSSTAGSAKVPTTILYLYGLASDFQKITVDGFNQGQRGAGLGMTAVAFQFDLTSSTSSATTGTQPVFNIRNGHIVFGLTGSPMFFKQTANFDLDLITNISDVVIETEDSTTNTTNPSILRVDADSAGLKTFNLSNFTYISQRSGGQGIFVANAYTGATAGRTFVNVVGGELRGFVYFASVANDADNKTRIVGSGVNVSSTTYAADALNDGATTGELSVNFPGLSWGGDSYRGTAVKGDAFVNTYTGGAPFAALGAIPVIYDGTNWKAI